MASEQQSVEPGIPDEGSGSMDCLTENGLVLQPVSDGASGQGLPYAPADWPNPGDVWRWKVGKRKNSSGFMADRYLYLPQRLKKTISGRTYFASLQSLKEFMQVEFPDVNIKDFLASFSWKVPSKDHRWDFPVLSSICPMQEMDAHSGSGSNVGTMKCKARNKICNLQLEEKGDPLAAMDCDICCSDAGFCRNCCCILCSRSIDWDCEGYSFIRCEGKLSESYVCGHASHIDCALRCYLAGTVGGSIGLEAEYHCRRCDQRTDLTSHVARLLKVCKSLNSRDDVAKLLQMGECVLRGSRRENAKKLRSRINLVSTKLKSGIFSQDIWNEEDNTSKISSGEMPRPGNGASFALVPHRNPHELNDAHRRYEEILRTTLEHQEEALKLEDEVGQVLQDLRRSQEIEYRMAEDRLDTQKDLLLGLYRQLGAARSELEKVMSSSMNSKAEALFNSISNIVSQIKQEVAKLKEMEEVAKGFGRAPTGVLSKHFGFRV